MKVNYLKYIVKNIMSNIINIFIIGTVLQTFLLEKGVGEHEVSILESGILILQTLVLVFVSGKVEKMNNMVKSFAVTATLRAVVIIPMLVFCFTDNVPVYTVFCVIVIARIIGTFFEASNIVISYKVPYHIIDIKDYGKVTSVSGVWGSICAIAISAVITYLGERLGFFNGMKYMLIFAFVILCIEFHVALTMNKVSFDKTESINTLNESQKSIWCYKPFYMLLLPNLARGICTGVLNVAAVIGYHYKVIDAKSASVIVVMLPLAGIFGTFLYTKLCNKNADGVIILISSVVVLFTMPFMAGFGTVSFLLAYFVSKFAMTVIDYSIPVAVTKIVDYSHIGRYSAWRMVLHTLGTAIGSGSIIFLVNCFGGIIAFILTGLCIAFCGVIYFTTLRLYGIEKV